MPGRAFTRKELENPDRPIVLPSDEFLAMFLGAHRQGEHVAIVGPTGGGKTTLGLVLCRTIGLRMAKDRRPTRVCILAYKPRDDTMREILPEKEWPVVKRWPPNYGQEHCIVWVRGGTPSKAAQRQRAVFGPLLDTIYQDGSQTVYIPEAAHFERKPPDGLGFSGLMTEFWSSARSNKLSVISDTQRPRWVTVSMWSEPSWLMIFQPEDDQDLRRVAQLSGNQVAVWNIVPNLGDYEFLCVRRQRGMGSAGRALYVSRIDVTRNKHNSRGKR